MSRTTTKDPKPGARMWRFVEGALRQAIRSQDGDAGVDYTKSANYDRITSHDIADIIVRNGWGEITDARWPRIRITSAGREALPRVTEMSRR